MEYITVQDAAKNGRFQIGWYKNIAQKAESKEFGNSENSGEFRPVRQNHKIHERKRMPLFPSTPN